MPKKRRLEINFAELPEKMLDWYWQSFVPDEIKTEVLTEMGLLEINAAIEKLDSDDPTEEYLQSLPSEQRTVISNRLDECEDECWRRTLAATVLVWKPEEVEIEAPVTAPTAEPPAEIAPAPEPVMSVEEPPAEPAPEPAPSTPAPEPEPPVEEPVEEPGPTETTPPFEPEKPGEEGEGTNSI